MKYDNLMDRILDLDNLRIAYRKVVSNDGSAGIDGINVKELKDHLKANMLILSYHYDQEGTCHKQYWANRYRKVREEPDY